MRSCIIIPCYNEEKRLETDKFITFSKANLNIDFCFVDDGSADSTYQMITDAEEMLPERILKVKLNQNSGKAEAVRQGCLFALSQKRYEIIGFFDADLSTPLGEINGLVQLMEISEACEVVIGSRIKRLGGNINRKLYRHVLGRVFSTFASLILKLPVYDTQCGAKVFKSTVVEQTFHTSFTTSWLFDIEILARIRNKIGVEKSLEIIKEYPLRQWEEIGGSKLKFIHFLKVPLELLKLNKQYN